MCVEQIHHALSILFQLHNYLGTEFYFGEYYLFYVGILGEVYSNDNVITVTAFRCEA